MCPNHNGPLCTTCRLGGLIRCPILGVPLPLVERERLMARKPTKVWFPGELTEEQKLAVYQLMRNQGYFE